MKVIVEQKPIEDFDEFQWGVDATFYTGEDADATNCIYMFARAMQLEGYAQKSIADAMKNWLAEYDEELK